jgi:hypothetical protein
MEGLRKTTRNSQDSSEWTPPELKSEALQFEQAGSILALIGQVIIITG